MYKFKFTDIGEGLHEGKITEILVKVGDSVKDGDDLFIVETEKVTTEIASPVDGIIKEILIKEGEEVRVGDVTFIIDTKDGKEEQKEDHKKNEEAPASVVGEVKVSNEELPSIFGPKEKPQEKSVDQKVKTSTDDYRQTKTSKYFKEKNILITPLARAIALDLNVDLNAVKGSGLYGRILIDDVKNFHTNKEGSSSRQEDSVSLERKKEVQTIKKEVRKKVTNIRKSIATIVKRSWVNVAYTNLVTEVDVTKLVVFRKHVRDYAREVHGVNVTFLSYVLKAFAIALTEFPVFNAVYDEKTEEIVFKKYYNIGIAVDTSYGLVVPVIQDVDKKPILEISKSIRDLAKKARDRKLTIQDQMNGTFTVTNFGSVRSSFGVPIIKYPELAICGMGTIFKRAVVENEKAVNKSIMYLTVAADHRWIDGADIGRFTFRVKRLLESPEQLSLY